MISELPTAGLHYGLSYADYAAWPAINFSRLKPIRGTASKCKYELDNPKKQTPAMTLGSALHVAVLEPARFESLFYICPPCDRRTTEGKQVFEAHKQKAGDKLLIRDGSGDDESLLGEVQHLRGMAKSIRAMKAAAPFLNGAGQNEVSMLWRDEETGLWCKARMDRSIEDLPKLQRPVTVEIKTARDASEWMFAKDCDSRSYDAQAASYRHGYSVITGKSPVHVFIVAENFPPYDCACYMLDDHGLQTGILKYRQMLNRYAECVKTNQWPGYPDKVQPLSLPNYAHERSYAD